MRSRTWFDCKLQRIILTTGLLIRFAEIFIGIPGTCAIPINNHTLGADSFERAKTLANRQDENSPPLPPGSTGSGPGADLDFYGSECKMGLYQGGFRNPNGRIDAFPEARWEGFPLGTTRPGEQPIVVPDHRCVNMRDLHPSLPNQISSFILTGYCECRFYHNEGCPPDDRGFSAYNRQDGALYNNGPDDDALESFSCWRTNHFLDFSYCTIRLSDNPSKDSGQKINVLFWRGDLEGTPDRMEGESDCKRLPDGYNLRYYKINGCSCRFYHSEDCGGGAVLTDGNPGRVERVDGMPGGIRSYRCLLPFGIPWGARDDFLG
ncbi:hypothetical protein TWF281_007122 [Arthrobotrys megalospora]